MIQIPFRKVARLPTLEFWKYCDVYSITKFRILAHSAAVHFCPAAAAISIVKKHHHLDFNGNNSWNGNAHVTTGTSTIPYEASVLYKILWGQPANRPQQPLEATQWTILPQFGSVHLLLPFSKSSPFPHFFVELALAYVLCRTCALV